MFKRRNPRSIFSSFANGFWPTIGWRRAFSYYWQRLMRIPGSPESLATGLACGATVSILPLVGFHFLQAAMFALVLRGSLLTSAIGTIVGNPWTFPFIWVGTYEVGLWLLGQGRNSSISQSFLEMFDDFFDAVISGNWPLFVAKVWPVWWPMMVGSVPIALTMGFSTNWLMAQPLREFRDLRMHRNRQSRK